MKPVAAMTQPELGAYVQSHLAKMGIEVVLSGGASVSVYSDGEYVSKDLDMVNVNSARRPAITKAMNEIGFAEEGGISSTPNHASLLSSLLVLWLSALNPSSPSNRSRCPPAPSGSSRRLTA
jgi:hypothetical protein